MNLNLNQPEDDVGGEGGQIKTDVATFHCFTSSHGLSPYSKHVGTVLPNFTSFDLFPSGTLLPTDPRALPMFNLW